MEQLTINFEAAEAAKDAAIAQVKEGASDLIRDIVRAAILRTASQRPNNFITADVRAELGDDYARIREPRLLGAVMKALQSEGLIAPTDATRPSGLRVNHNYRQRVWRKI